ncbi:MAG TPA: hypothetical protein RMH99_19730 [Sandaracinaceae bacterium LLY-WYZ-13_1]|nr:hypothetical protein [Sandaracinaceae bacterium LLY-WYZ-13_1]
MLHRLFALASAALAVAGCSGTDCASVACEPCPNALQIEVDANAPTAPIVRGPVSLTCARRAGGWSCYRLHAEPGTYDFDVEVAATIRSVTLVVGEGTDEGCCTCEVTSDRATVTFDPFDAGADEVDAGRDGGADGGALDDAGATVDARAPRDAGPPADAGACRPALVDFPMGGDLSEGTLCDDVFACVPSEAAASVEAATVFACDGVSGIACDATHTACRYADPGGPRALDADEIAAICELTVFTPAPSGLVCRVYL